MLTEVMHSPVITKLSILNQFLQLRPYRKNEQAFIERFNRAVCQECLGWRKYRAKQIPELQALVEQLFDHYHLIRPSMAFDPMRPPSVFSLGDYDFWHLT